LVEIIFKFITYIFVDILFEGVFSKFFELIKKANDFVLDLRFGKQSKFSDSKKENQSKALEKKLLYKKIESIEQLNPFIKKGSKGTILEIINHNKILAEFYDSNNKQIEFENKLVFEIKMNQFKLLENKT